MRRVLQPHTGCFRVVLQEYANLTAQQYARTVLVMLENTSYLQARAPRSGLPPPGYALVLGC